MTYPTNTGPELATKDTTKDVSVNTSQFFNGQDWNDMRTLVHGLRDQMVGTPRAAVAVRSSGTLTAVTVRTATVLVDGYFKEVASARVLKPGVTGTTIVAVRPNPTGIAGAVVTFATAQAPYATTTRDFPIARVRVTGGVQTIEHIRPDWILGAGL